MKYPVYNQQGQISGDYELPEKIFSVKHSAALLHQAIVTQEAGSRKVLADTKDRSEVSGGGKKPWAQKGTGRARVGSSRSPIWIGGGVTFGPTNDRNFKLHLNQKMRQKAMFMIMSDKAADKQLALLDKFELADFKTKECNKVISALENQALPKAGKSRSVLVIGVGNTDKIKNSTRNLTGVKLLNLDNLNAVDLLKYRSLILTVDAAKAMAVKFIK